MNWRTHAKIISGLVIVGLGGGIFSASDGFDVVIERAHEGGFFVLQRGGGVLILPARDHHRKIVLVKMLLGGVDVCVAVIEFFAGGEAGHDALIVILGERRALGHPATRGAA